MATIPTGVAQESLQGLPLVRRGKVHDTYGGLTDETHIFPIASDRISAFDFVLNATIKDKGPVLTAMNVFWRIGPLRDLIGSRHDLVAFGADIDRFLPQQFQGNPELQKRALVIMRKKMCPFEAIIRGYLTGTALEAYRNTTPHTVCGHVLPDGLEDGAALPEPIFTPSTKAEVGHDVHLDAAKVKKQYGDEPERLGLAMYRAANGYARERGIIIADTKFEFWLDDDGTFGIGDEVLTPDSSRFWLYFMWELAQRRSPQGMDKQYVRDYLKGLNVDLLDPENLKHLTRVGALELPEEIRRVTTRLYRYAFWKLVGCKLEAFQRKSMGISVADARPKIEIVIGSESDRWQLDGGLRALAGRTEHRVTVLSCHRNDDREEALERFVRDHLIKADVVIAGAGEAAALPGILKTKLCKYGCFYIPVIGVACKGKDGEADIAAALSIKRLPGQPVELDPYGEAYFGPDGFRAACLAAFHDEFYPKTIEAKPTNIGEWVS